MDSPAGNQEACFAASRGGGGQRGAPSGQNVWVLSHVTFLYIAPALPASHNRRRGRSTVAFGLLLQGGRALTVEAREGGAQGSGIADNWYWS